MQITETGPGQPRWSQLSRASRTAAIANTVVLFGAFPDLVVALARHLRGERGAQLGPTLVTLGIAAVTPTVSRLAVRHQGPVAAGVLGALVVATVTAPLLAVSGRRTVVGHGSPFWSLAYAAGLRGTSALLTAALVVRDARRARAAEQLSS